MASPNPPVQTAYRIKLKFGLGQWGWTETYWYMNSNAILTTLSPAAIALAAVRLPLLRYDATLQAFAVAPAGGAFGPYENFKWAQGTGPLGAPIGTPNGFQSPIFDCILADCWDATLFFHRRFYLRGVPAAFYGDETPQRQRLLAPAALGPLATFLSFLSNQGATLGTKVNGSYKTWCIRAKNPNLAQTGGANVTGGTQDAQGCNLTLTLSPIPPTGTLWPYAVGDTVLLRRVHTDKGGLVHGNAKVMGFISPTLSLYKQSCCCGPSTIRAGGTVQYVVPSCLPIAVTGSNRIVTHHTGLGFFGTTGKRRHCSC